MASDYGLNFGFRRSDESMRSGTEGRLKVPAAGAFLQGDLVTFDPANPGFMKKAASGDPLQAGFTGLLIQEEGWDTSHYEVPVNDSFQRGKVRNGRLAAIWTGAGLKIWLKNTAAQNRADGRAIAQQQRLTAGALALPIGGYLAWSGTQFTASAAATDRVARVTLTNGTDYVECVLQS